MQHEDDLRGLAKVMQFMRAISVLLLVVHIYWFCYRWMESLGWTHPVVDRVLAGFQRTSGLFGSPLYTKLFCLLLLGLSCLGTRSVRSERITVRRIVPVAAIGTVLFFGCDILLHARLGTTDTGFLYTVALGAGYVCLLTAGIWLGRLLSGGMTDDPFNDENESFMQETRYIGNEYSVNLPTLFYYGKRWSPGWINVVNPFRASVVLGTPGSGKSYAVVNNYIKQMIGKGYSMYIYGAPVKAIS